MIPTGARLQRRKGQTVIEAIVALGVLTTGFLGILTLVSRSFTTVKNISNETTATYLAAEGIELARSILDHSMNSSSTAPWPCFPGVSPGTAADFGFDNSIFPGNPSNCPVVGLKRENQYLFFNAATGLYSYGGAGVKTGFKRDINISEASNDQNEVIVVSTVTWDGGASQVELEDHVYNWLP